MARLPSWLPASLLVVLIVALGLRLPYLQGSFWLDEAAQVLESARPFSQQLDIIPDFQPPLFHFLVHFSLYFSQTEWWLRLMTAVIPALVSVLATYHIGRHIHSTRVGLLSAILLATSSLHLFYSQELRPYSFPTMVATLSWWLIVAYKSNGSTNKVTYPFWVSWTILNLLGWYSSYLYPFLWLSQVLFLLFYFRNHWKKLFISAVVTVGGFAIWMPVFLQQLMAGQALSVDLPGWQSVVSLSQLKALPLVGAKFLFGVVNVEVNLFFMVTLILVLGFTVYLLWPKITSLVSRPKLEFPVVFLLCWLVLPLMAAWLVSFVIPVIQPKRVLFLLPSFYLFFAWLVSQSKSKVIGPALLFVLLSLNLFSVREYYTKPIYQRENWRELQHTLSSRYLPSNTVAVFAFPEPFAPWRWYDQGLFDTVSLGYINPENESSMREQLAQVIEYPYVISFDYLTDLSDPQKVVEDELKKLNYQTIEVLDYPNIGFVRIWARQGVTVSELSGTIEFKL